LRWGVTEDTTNTLELCLTELDNCRPFFIGLLGDRYGWCPDSYQLPDVPQFDWLKTIPLGHSITHLEFEHGCLRDPQNAKAAFYLRDSVRPHPSKLTKIVWSSYSQKNMF
jgi:telomerase protein component 1